MPVLLRLPTFARRLLVLTLLVLLAHGALLGGMHPVFGYLAGQGKPLAPPALVGSFATRTLPPQPEAPPPPPPPRPKDPAPRAHARSAPAAPAPAPPQASGTPTAAEAPTPNDASQPTQDTGPASSPQAAAPPVLPPDAQATPPVALAPPVRMRFDGRGEEKGFIKYTGSGELLWLPDATQYRARLEISTWGIRVRTWTSKGALDDRGLVPLRFGDRPRGAELATHFQRDKGIISFSANNPDVPLQPGAQDKLSAILQISALLAGAPERYGAGSSIDFQAADAHRAEAWSFVVGTTEALELPGGKLQGLKLSKAPTVEFDQRIEVWLAPALHYLPVRLRITEASGAYVDLLWQSNDTPEGE